MFVVFSWLVVVSVAFIGWRCQEVMGRLDLMFDKRQIGRKTLEKWAQLMGSRGVEKVSSRCSNLGSVGQPTHAINSFAYYRRS